MSACRREEVAQQLLAVRGRELIPDQPCGRVGHRAADADEPLVAASVVDVNGRDGRAAAPERVARERRQAVGQVAGRLHDGGDRDPSLESIS